MKILTIDGEKLKKFIIAGANMLNKDKENVNSLNVFPVPDGDTGTNMALTVLAAAEEASKVDSKNIYDVAKAISRGSLNGARGNSGVILSQMFRGFSKALEGKDIAYARDIANAFKKGMETAYKAVIKPKEGTILTVSKAISEKANEMALKTEDLIEVMKEVLKHANKTLEKTINMLPELKQAGVVDAGGKGLLDIIEGGLFGKFMNIMKDERVETNETSYLINEEINIKYPYCTEFFIQVSSNAEFKEEELKQFLESNGDSIVFINDEDLVKIHIHTANPSIILEKALSLGTIDKVKIENMKNQHTSMIDFKNSVQKDYGFIVISSGEGFSSIFKQLGVDEIILGGQAINTSTKEIIDIIEKINAKNIIIFPNNKNILFAAKQAKELSEDKNVIVLETVNIPESYAALTAFFKEKTLEENLKNMQKAIDSVLVGEVTFAVKKALIGSIEIDENDYIYIQKNEIKKSSKNLEEGTKEFLKNLISEVEEPYLVSIYYGENTSYEEALEISNFIEEEFSEIDVEVIFGGQPLYYYIISVE